MPKTTPRRLRLAATLLLAAVLAPGCHEDCVTCVDQRTPTPIPPALTDLSGQWTGTVREDASPCLDDAHPVTARVEQHGRFVKLTLSTAGACSHGGETTYEGTLDAYALSGFLSSSRPYKDDVCRMTGEADGTVSEQRIQIIGSLGGKCYSQGTTNVHVAFNLRRPAGGVR